MANRFQSTNLVIDNSIDSIRKADLDLLKKINLLALDVDMALSEGYTKAQTDALLALKVDTTFLTANYYTKSQVDTIVGGYVTNDSLALTLLGYVTTTTFNSTLANYELIANITIANTASKGVRRDANRVITVDAVNFVDATTYVKQTSSSIFDIVSNKNSGDSLLNIKSDSTSGGAYIDISAGNAVCTNSQIDVLSKGPIGLINIKTLNSVSSNINIDASVIAGSSSNINLTAVNINAIGQLNIVDNTTYLLHTASNALTIHGLNTTLDGTNVYIGNVNYATINTKTKDPTGFTDPQNVVVTFDSTTRKITLTGTVEAYWRGQLIPALVSG